MLIEFGMMMKVNNMKKYRLNINGIVYRNLTYEQATRIIEKEVKTEYDWFYLYEERKGE